jgi:hypothetical protein
MLYYLEALVYGVGACWLLLFFSPTVTATLFAIAATFHAPDSPRAAQSSQRVSEPTRAPTIQQPTLA